MLSENLSAKYPSLEINSGAIRKVIFCLIIVRIENPLLLLVIFILIVLDLVIDTKKYLLLYFYPFPTYV